jgi:hypothetical protein
MVLPHSIKTEKYHHLCYHKVDFGVGFEWHISTIPYYKYVCNGIGVIISTASQER